MTDRIRISNREHDGAKIKIVKKGAEKRASDDFLSDISKYGGLGGVQQPTTPNGEKTQSLGEGSADSGTHRGTNQRPIPNSNHGAGGGNGSGGGPGPGPVPGGSGGGNSGPEPMRPKGDQFVKNHQGVPLTLKESAGRAGQNLGGMVRSGMFMPANKVRQEADTAASAGMRKSQEYQYSKDVGLVAASIAVHAIQSVGNSNILQDINFGKNITDSNRTKRINISDLTEANKILYKSNTTWNPDFQLRNKKDLERLLDGINEYSKANGYGKIAGRNPGDLDRLSETIQNKITKIQAGKGNMQELSTLMDMQKLVQASKEVAFEQKSGKILKSNGRSIRQRIKRVALDPVRGTDFYQGYHSITQTKMVVKATTKAVFMEYRGIYKIGRFLCGKSSIGIQAALKATGNQNLIMMASGIQKMTQGVGTIANMGENTVNSVLSAPKKVKSKIHSTKYKVSDRMRYAKAHVKGTKTYKDMRRKVRTTKAGKSIRKAKWSTKKTYRNLAKSPIGKSLKFGKKVITSPFKTLNAGFRALAAAGHLLMGLLAKLAMLIGIMILIVTIVSSTISSFMVIFSTIGDAVSDTLEDFKRNTTMGATYEKLQDKEQEFNAAIAGLAESLTIPADGGYSDQGITKYTNVNVHYIGADGREISWSGAIGDIEVDPTEVSDRVWTHMKKKGWSNIAIAGLLGNIQQESNFRVGATEHSSDDGSPHILGSGFGLCQWTNTNGDTNGRRAQLFQYAARKGKSVTDVELQMDYLLYGEGKDSVKARQYGRMNFGSVAEATTYFCNEWERPKAATAHLGDVRIPAANRFYEYYTTNPDFSDIEEEEGSEEMDESVENDYINASFSTADTSTIKGILSMAAVYIEQDFKKYGAYLDGIFADSVYKDYCAKLYDSTHIIGVDQTPPQVYYCPAYSAFETEPEYCAATTSCNNKLPGGSSESDWLSGGYSLKIRKERDSYTRQCSKENCDRDHTIHYDRYTVDQAGPHGTVTYSTGEGGNEAAYARETMRERGCKHFRSFCIDRGDGYSTQVYACYCDLCKGHIDADAYVFVSNVYDPHADVVSEPTTEQPSEPSEEGDAEEGTGNGNQTTENKKDDDGKAFENIENTNKEYRYSMYVLDKYATAFDRPGNEAKYVYCTNPSCSHYKNMDNVGDYASTSQSVTMVRITPDDTDCPECGTTLRYPNAGRPGDAESCDAADATENKAAEQEVMETLTGKPMKIVNWWTNEGWFSNLSTAKTYFRLANFEDSIDTLPVPEPDENGDKNVVNKSNSTPYWFNAFTSPSGRNVDFEKHGWDSDSIMQVRMLMAADWEELYGIKDFGSVMGAPMTDAQIAQLVANNPSWEELCDDRKAIIANALLFNQKASALGLTYHQSQPLVKTMAQFQAARSVQEVADGTCANKNDSGHGFDCSAYVGFILYNSGLYGTPRPTTSSIRGQIGTVFERIDGSQLLPGDIALSSKHVVLYLGNGKVSEAREHGVRLDQSFNQPKPAIFGGGYTFLRLKSIDESKHTIDLSDLTGKSNEENSEN